MIYLTAWNHQLLEIKLESAERKAKPQASAAEWTRTKISDDGMLFVFDCKLRGAQRSSIAATQTNRGNKPGDESEDFVGNKICGEHYNHFFEVFCDRI